jgi:hypothetical protein
LKFNAGSDRIGQEGQVFDEKIYSSKIFPNRLIFCIREFLDMGKSNLKDFFILTTEKWRKSAVVKRTRALKNQNIKDNRKINKSKISHS